jgi:hypothetical protein
MAHCFHYSAQTLDYTMAGVLDVLGQCNSIKIRNK